MVCFRRQRGARRLNRPIRRFAAKRFADDSGHAQERKKPQPVNRLITTKPEGRDAVALALYFSAFALAGLPLNIRIALTRPLPEPRTALLLSILGLVSYHLPATLPSNVRLHPGFPLLMGALYSHGCSAAILVIAPAMLLHFFTRRHGLLNCLFNALHLRVCCRGCRLAVGLATRHSCRRPRRSGGLSADADLRHLEHPVCERIKKHRQQRALEELRYQTGVRR